MPNPSRTRHTQLRTISETSARLACSTRTVWQFIALGHLTPIKIGTRSTRIDDAEIERFIEDRRIRK